MLKKVTAVSLMMLFTLSIITTSFAAPMQQQAPPPPKPTQTGSALSDLASLTSGLSSFFGQAMSFMTQAIGYLTGGVQAASLFQTGTNIINGMVVNGPKPPNVPLPQVTMPGAPAAPAHPAAQSTPTPLDDAQMPSGTAPSTSSEAPQAAPSLAPEAISNEDFSGLLKSYNALAAEENNVLKQMKENPDDAALKDIYNQVQTSKLEKSSKIMASLNYDIEKKQFSKLNLLLEYVNVNGPQTVKIFGQIIDSTRGKLQFCLIEAKKFGLTMDIQVIEGKLKLVMSLGTGNFTPTAPPPSVPLDGGIAPAPAPANHAPASTGEVSANDKPEPKSKASARTAKTAKPAKKSSKQKSN